MKKEQDKVNKKPLAVALTYHEDQDNAPRVVASGRGVVAENIIREAQKAGVSIHENGDLAQSLVKLEIGQAIPEELYNVVARILAFVYDLDHRQKEQVIQQLSKANQ